jgi:hypothetical protein
MKKKQRFQVHSLDDKGQVVSKKYLKSDERRSAVVEAMKLASTHPQEVWQGRTLVVHIDPRPAK